MPAQTEALPFLRALALLVSYVVGTDRRRAGLVALIAIGEGLTAPLVIAASGLVLSRAPGALGTGVSSPQSRALIVAVLVVGAAFVAGRVLTPIRTAVSTSLGSRVGERMQVTLLEATLTPYGIAHLENPDFADEIRRAGDFEWEGLAPLTRIVDELSRTVTLVVGAVGAAALLARFEWWAPVLLLAAVVVTHVGTVGDAYREVRRRDDLALEQRHADYFRDLALDPPAAKEVRLFGLADYLADSARRHRSVFVEALVRARRAQLWPVLATIGALASAAGLVFGVLGYEAVHGTVDAADLAVYVQATYGVLGLCPPMLATWWVRQGVAAVPHLLGLAARAAEVPAGIAPGGAPVHPAAPEHTIRLRDVHFAYPGVNRPVLDGVDLELRAGTSLAIVGANGSGKTTLLKLLARLYDPTSGAIEVDGSDLRQLDAVAWRRQLAVIFQDFTRFELTAADNVGFGRVEPRADLVAARAAADAAGAGAVVDDLPDGWATTLSRRYPGGVDLSGGQWQRIALARALRAAAGGARVLVLDEPTAALDVRSEARLFDSFLDLTAGLTTVLVTHRLASVRRTDRIAVLDRGRVIELGSHDELMGLGGRYATMFGLQAGRFSEAADVDGAGQARDV